MGGQQSIQIPLLGDCTTHSWYENDQDKKNIEVKDNDYILPSGESQCYPLGLSTTTCGEPNLYGNDIMVDYNSPEKVCVPCLNSRVRRCVKNMSYTEAKKQILTGNMHPDLKSGSDPQYIKIRERIADDIIRNNNPYPLLDAQQVINYYSPGSYDKGEIYDRTIKKVCNEVDQDGQLTVKDLDKNSYCKIWSIRKPQEITGGQMQYCDTFFNDLRPTPMCQQNATKLMNDTVGEKKALTSFLGKEFGYYKNLGDSAFQDPNFINISQREALDLVPTVRDDGYEKMWKDYCEKNIDDPKCACFKVMNDSNRYGVFPECISNNCANNPQTYKPVSVRKRGILDTSGKINFNCPNVCTQIINTTAGNLNVLENINFYQKCFNTSESSGVYSKVLESVHVDIGAPLDSYKISNIYLSRVSTMKGYITEKEFLALAIDYALTYAEYDKLKMMMDTYTFLFTISIKALQPILENMQRFVEEGELVLDKINKMTDITTSGYATEKENLIKILNNLPALNKTISDMIVEMTKKMADYDTKRTQLINDAKTLIDNYVANYPDKYESSVKSECDSIFSLMKGGGLTIDQIEDYLDSINNKIAESINKIEQEKLSMARSEAYNQAVTIIQDALKGITYDTENPPQKISDLYTLASSINTLTLPELPEIIAKLKNDVIVVLQELNDINAQQKDLSIKTEQLKIAQQERAELIVNLQGENKKLETYTSDISFVKDQNSDVYIKLTDAIRVVTSNIQVLTRQIEEIDKIINDQSVTVSDLTTKIQGIVDKNNEIIDKIQKTIISIPVIGNQSMAEKIKETLDEIKLLLTDIKSKYGGEYKPYADEYNLIVTDVKEEMSERTFAIYFNFLGKLKSFLEIKKNEKTTKPITYPIESGSSSGSYTWIIILIVAAVIIMLILVGGGIGTYMYYKKKKVATGIIYNSVKKV